MRRGAPLAQRVLWALPLLLGSLQGGCHIPTLEPAPTLENGCSESRPCRPGGSCLPLEAAGSSPALCVSTRVDLPGLFLEVRPDPQGEIAPGTSYLLTPSFLRGAEQLGGGGPLQTKDTRGVQLEAELELPKLVALEQGQVQADLQDISRTCAFAEGNVGATIELQRNVSLLGLAPARYQADSSLQDVGDGPRQVFRLDVPPDVYDVHVQPKVEADCPLPPLPPFFFRAQTLDKDATLSVVLPPTRLLRGTLALPHGASVNGWTVEVVEPYGGRNVSTLASLTHVDWAENVEFELRYSWTFPAAPVLRLRPPEGGQGPTLHWDLATADIDGDGEVALSLAGFDAAAQNVEAKVLGPDGTPRVALVEFHSTSLSNVANASFERVVESGTDGSLSVELLPGDYRVVVRSLVREDEALVVDAWEVGAEAPCCDHELRLSSRVELLGKVKKPSGEPAVEGSLLASPQLPAPSSYLPTVLGLAPVLPREASGLVDLEGKVELLSDPGLFDLSLRPPSASRFPWALRPGLEVKAGRALDLGALDLSYPVLLRGQLRDGLGRPLAGALVRAWVPASPTQEEEGAQGLSSVLPAGEVRTDALGGYLLLLPPSLGW